MDLNYDSKVKEEFLENLNRIKQRTSFFARKKLFEFEFLGNAWDKLWEGQEYTRRKHALYLRLFYDCVKEAFPGHDKYFQGTLTLNGEDFWVGLNLYKNEQNQIKCKITIGTLLHYFLFQD